MSMTEGVVMRASCGAALKKVTILMNVEAMLFSWVEASEVAFNLTECLSSSLAEVDHTLSYLIGLRVQDTNSLTNDITFLHFTCDLLS